MSLQINLLSISMYIPKDPAKWTAKRNTRRKVKCQVAAMRIGKFRKLGRDHESSFISFGERLNAMFFHHLARKERLRRHWNKPALERQSRQIAVEQTVLEDINGYSIWGNDIQEK